MIEEFFTQGLLYTDRLPSQAPGVHVEFTVHAIVEVPGTEERVAFGFRRWNDVRDPNGAGRWYPAHMDERNFAGYVVKQD